MTPLRNFLEKGILPLDQREALKIKYRASSYTIINGRMYHRSVSQPLLRCLNTEEQRQALEAVHEGICGEHLVDRIPKICISDNGTQFIRNKFRKFLYHFRIEQRFSSVAHPQGNGAIEAAYKVIFRGIKKRLGEAKGRWSEELLWILWAYRTTPRTSTGETPFRMAYGTEALVPVEVELESYRTEVYNMETNNFRLRANVDLLEEEREAAHQRNMKYLLQPAQHYDSNIKKRSFGVGDLVLRELAALMPTKQGKFQPNWEGPYKVTEVVRPGTFKLEKLSDEAFKNT
ncbi:uncharacterized protein LOC141704708 [Apium graveolens]|uniref:uncharacterized protein LOC141704708 n=1 Tax=Apium graveolens TaxID=4045 RepID=UPI003D7901DD